FAQIRPWKRRLGHVRVAQIGSAQPRPAEIRSRQVRAAKVAAFEIGVAQNGPGEIDLRQIRAEKFRTGEIGPRPTFFPTEEAFVRLQDGRHALTVMLNAFELPKSHILLFSLGL